jgi:hypothetical protein
MFMVSVTSTVIAQERALIMNVHVILDLFSMIPMRNSADATGMPVKVFVQAAKKGESTMSPE